MTEVAHRYQLEKYSGRKSKFRCPGCNKENRFVRYVDVATGEYISDEVGRCDREDQCGYHKKPREYFSEHPDRKNLPPKEYRPTVEEKPVSLISFSVVEKTMKRNCENNFIGFLVDLFGATVAQQLQEDYMVGSSKHWKGATIFWQVDENCGIRTGKVMLYNRATGKRVKDPHNHINWVHKILKLDRFNFQQCFFGQHLLSDNPGKKIAVVESEKTAIICSVYYPMYLWIATGGASGKLNNRRVYQVLEGRDVSFFPDAGCFTKWNDQVENMRKSIRGNFRVSPYLEGNVSREEALSGIDIADALLLNRSANGLAMSPNQGYPQVWDYAEADHLFIAEANKWKQKASAQHL